jgi:hypothetical protein
MVATLTRVFGVHNLALAEDVVQDAFCRALEVWKFRGVPENPSAWLLATAKNRALDVLRRQRTARTFAPELRRLLDSEFPLPPRLHRPQSMPLVVSGCSGATNPPVFLVRQARASQRHGRPHVASYTSRPPHRGSDNRRCSCA